MDIYLEGFQHNQDEVKSVLASFFSVELDEVLIVSEFNGEVRGKKIICEITKYDEFDSKFSTCMTLYCYIDGGINLWKKPQLLYSIISEISQKLKVRCMISHRVPDNCMYLFDPCRRHQKVEIEGDEIMTISSFLIDLRFDMIACDNKYIYNFDDRLDKIKDMLTHISAEILEVNPNRIFDREGDRSFENAIYFSLDSYLRIPSRYFHRYSLSLPVDKFYQPMEEKWLEVNDFTFAKTFSKEIRSSCLIQDLSLEDNEFMQINPNGRQNIFTLYPDKVFFP